MPTLNPRVNVTLSPSLDALVAQFAGLQRVSKSTVLRELLETVEPSLRQVVALMEAAKVANVKARKTIADDMQHAIKAADGVQSLMMSVAAHHTRDMVQEAEEVRGRRPARGRRGAAPVAGAAPRAAGAVEFPKVPKRPPSSNRGVKS
jgi:hypothetical protein